MSMRINLLKPDEYRHQGVVSRRFMAMSALLAVGGIVALAVVYFGFQFLSLRGDVKSMTRQWTQMEKRFQADERMQDDAVRLGAVLRELEGWNRGRLEWSRFLRLIRDLVPAGIQLTQLSGTMEWEPYAAPKDSKTLPPSPARRLKLNLSGRAVGEGADQVVTRFVRQLQESLSPDYLDNVKMQSMQTESIRMGGVREQAARSFRIEATGPARKLE